MDGWMDQWIDQSNYLWIDGSLDLPMDQSMYWSMDQCINWLVDGFINRWIDGWFDRWIDWCINGLMDGWIYRSIDQCIDGCIDGLIDRWIDRPMDRSIEWWMDGSIDGSMDGWIDRSINQMIYESMDRWTVHRHPSPHLLWPPPTTYSTDSNTFLPRKNIVNAACLWFGSVSAVLLVSSSYSEWKSSSAMEGGANLAVSIGTTTSCKCRRKRIFVFYAFLWTCWETIKSQALKMFYRASAGALKGW